MQIFRFGFEIRPNLANLRILRFANLKIRKTLLKTHRSPGYHSLTSEDFRSLISYESPDNKLDTKAKLASLRFVFEILVNFWFNETVPRDFKRTILCPFLKNEDKNHYDPENYKPISRLNTHENL